jgi:hypothetical protein
VRAAALAVALVLALAACGGDGDGNGVVPSATPADPPPERPGEGPPPAWVETEGGSIWLAYSTYCWGSTCADFVAPSCAGDTSAPRVELRRGETVRFHLGFDPGEASLTFFPEGGEPDGVTLDPSRTPAWQADRAGAFTVFAGGDGRDASYAGCAVLR